MDDNTAEVLRVLIAAIFGVFAFGGIIWGMSRIGGESIALPAPEPYTWEYTTSPYDDAEWEQERQELRDRLAEQIWANRRLTRERATQDGIVSA